MIRKLLLLFSPVLLYSFAVVFNQPAGLVQKLEDYLAFYTPEKVYLHTDKPYYSAGDTIWFAAYLTHGVSHMALAPSRIVYVELINEKKEVLARRDLGIEYGTGAGEFALADTLVEGRYLLRGYTSFMRNFDQGFFYTKEIRIVGLLTADAAAQKERSKEQRTAPANNRPLDKLVNIQLFPEGGDMVEGLWGTVGVKVTSPDGGGIVADGKIVDSNGKQVSIFSTGYLGMGKLRIFPEKGQKYLAVLTFGQETVEKLLPPIKEQGFVLNVSALEEEFIAIEVTGNQADGAKGGVLIGHVRGATFIEQEAGGNILEALIPKANVPEGIATFTWFDAQGMPQCERLVFNERPDLEVGLEINGLEETYGKRSRIAFEVQPEIGEEPDMIFSVAVTDKAKINNTTGADNLRSYLLLSSDLKGQIENPAYYFGEADNDKRQDLDNLLLTQGWRRFNWQEVANFNKNVLPYDTESGGFQLKGVATDFYNKQKPLAESRITLTAANRLGHLAFMESKTDSIGYFLFDSLDIFDTTNIIFQTPQSLKENKNLKGKLESGQANSASAITLLPYISPEVLTAFGGKEKGADNGRMIAFLEEMRKVSEVEAAFSDKETVILQNIDVESSRIIEHKRFEPPGKIYSHVDIRLDVDSISKYGSYATMFDLFYGIPGVTVIQQLRADSAIPRMELVLRGSGTLGGNIHPLYLIDGVPADIELVKGIPVSRIDFIDVLTGTGSTMYGSRGSAGVVAIYLKDGRNIKTDYEAKGVASFIHSGYYHAREFYSPDYNVKRQSHVRPDIRPTLYWKAGQKTAEGAPAKLEFFTSDVASTFEIIIEGITRDGRPFVKVEEFVVN